MKLDFQSSAQEQKYMRVMMRAVALVSANGIMPRVAFYVIGLVVCAIGVSLLFHIFIRVREVNDDN